MKGVHFIKDETDDRRYVQIELSALKKIREGGRSVASFLEDLEDMLDFEMSKDQEGKPWDQVKAELQRKDVLSKDV